MIFRQHVFCRRVLSVCMLLILGVLSAYSQTTVLGSKLTDQWSWGISGGIYAPASHHAVLHDARPLVGMKIAKEITPVFGLSLEANAAFNSPAHVQGGASKTVVDAMDVSGLVNLNLSNLLGGYRGRPRSMELVAVYGMGWGHLFYPESVGKDVNMLVSRAGCEWHCYMNTARSWYFHVRPAIVWALTGNDSHHICRNTHYNINQASLELTTGVTWHFRNSRHTFHFIKARLYDQSETDALNAKINDMRNLMHRKDREIGEKEKTIDSLKHQMEILRSKERTCATAKDSCTGNYWESVVSFLQGQSDIEISQYPVVERIAMYLKKHENSRVVIQGYASPEGCAAVNDRLAKSRAESVKKMLIYKYGISQKRIQTKGQGAGDIFSEPEWNRVAIATLIEEN